MREPLGVVTLLVASSALSSILATTLASAPSLRVRAFDTEVALRAYLRIAPVDVLIADFDNVESPADQLADRLRHDGGLLVSNLQIIALASRLTPEHRAISARAGIDELVVKPMSPKYLRERVESRLARAKLPDRRHGPRRDWSIYGNNVVPLFDRPRPNPH